MVRATYRRLFEGITLTPEQEASARALIARTQLQMRPRTTQRDVKLRINPRSGLVSIRAPNDSLLIALVSNDDDRAKLLSRIVSIAR